MFGFAESSSLRMLSAHLGTAYFGVVKGKPRPSADKPKATNERGVIEGDDIDAHIFLVARGEQGEFAGSCSGTLIEGCILTASHCGQTAAEGPPIKNWEVYMGEKPNRKDLIGIVENTTDTVSLLGKGEEEPSNDLAVMKTTAFLEFGLSRSMLATARPKVGSQLELSGYGFSRTVDGADVGEGKRLGGTIKVDGFFKFLKDWIPDHKGGPGNSLFLLPDPQIAAPGDSGAALTQDGKIVALVSGGHEEDTQEAQLSILPPARVNRIKFNTAAPIADNRENILKALDKMKCSENLHTVQLAKLFANPVFDSLGTESWEKLIEGKKSEISSLISNLINPVPNKEVKIKPISSKNPNIRIVRAEIEYEDGWKESLRITLDSDKPGFWEIRREEMRAR